MKKKKIFTFSITICCLIVLLVDGFVMKNYEKINHFFNADIFDREEFKEASFKSDELVKKIEEEGTVLLKNQNDCLPLVKEEKESYPVNLFGWSSIDCGNVLRGIGTGYGRIDDSKKVTLSQALEENGFSVNQELLKFYEDFYKEDFNKKEMATRDVLFEPNLDSYPSSYLKNASNFSDTAIVTISRISGENCNEIKQYQEKINSLGETRDVTRHYLELSAEERELITYVEENYSKVIILVNSTNPFELSFVDEEGIDACLLIGVPGQSGMDSVARILLGKASPSGRLTDTYLKDFTKEPSYPYYKAEKNKNNQSMVLYQENIYVGYRFYETAYVDGFFKGNAYEDIVQYPFGYGLSYTSFSWEVDEIKLPDSKKGEETIEVSLSCTNNGNFPGKDVLFLFARKPYTNGGIEKAYSTLCSFTKSSLLNPGEIQKDIKLTFSLYDLCSFDCYDKNNNGFCGYELEKGTYDFVFQENSHEQKKMTTENRFSYEIPEDIFFAKDTSTEKEVKPRLTQLDSFGKGIDGSSFSDHITYLSRKDFQNTYQKTFSLSDVNSSLIDEVNGLSCYDIVKEKIDEKPVFGQDNGLYLVKKEDGSRPTMEELDQLSVPFVYDMDLLSKIVEDDGETLNLLVSQMTKKEVKSIVEKSGFGTESIYSIAKPRYQEYDGTCGLNTMVFSTSSTLWTAFPSMTVLGQTFNTGLAYQMGESVGLEAKETGVNAWYAPSGNLHRSSFNGRNGEYFSEDPLLTGHMAGNIIKGAKSKGLITYMKHFVMAELGDNEPGVNEFNTEQALREIYLKPFEIAVKDYSACGMMSSFNRIGAVWTGASYPLLTEILRGEWGFKGAVISDYSDGSEPLSTTSGIVAGNDIWLNVKEKNALPLSEEDDVYMAKAKDAVSHYLYLLSSTLVYQKNHIEDKNVALILRPVKRNTFPLWLVFFVLINSVLFVSMVFASVCLFRKKEEESND